MKRSKNGFTLVELLVVISIMSILTIITVSQFMTARMRARDVAVKGDLGSMSKALQMYFADYGKFPDKIGSSVPKDADTGWPSTFIAGPDNYVYMKVLPKSKTTTPYCYVVSSDLKTFGLFAMLENTKDLDCSGSYVHCGGKSYCYSVVSPNTTAADLSPYSQ